LRFMKGVVNLFSGKAEAPWVRGPRDSRVTEEGGIQAKG
jgi:hypothetical protein